MDLIGLGTFMRTRREALQPEDVGMPRGARRRTSGLRREEVASLVGMSPDYYARLERGAGPQPSEQMVAALARGLRLSLRERDHLFALAGLAFDMVGPVAVNKAVLNVVMAGILRRISRKLAAHLAHLAR